MGYVAKWVRDVILILIFSAVVATIITGGVYLTNSDRVEACQHLSGELTSRGFNCVLPSGEIVDPVKRKESNEHQDPK